MRLLLMTLPLAACAQQSRDDTFRFQNERSALPAGTGPNVCIDEGHFNFHTVDGRFRPFAELLRTDGYTVEGYDDGFAERALQRCAVLVIANPLSAKNAEDWSYPHPSAFSGAEMEQLMRWVREGGRLLLFADHAPVAGAARDLAAVFGVVMIDVFVDNSSGPDVFRVADGTLADHAIQQGRSASERVDSIMTFTGQALQITRGWEHLMVFGPDAVGRISLHQSFQEGPRQEWPSFPVDGWVLEAGREWESGRVVFLGETAMCSAQFAAGSRAPMGMNIPGAEQNPQFCLNVVRWLTGVIDG